MGGSKSMTLAALLAVTIGLAMIAERGNAVTICGVDDDGQDACKPSITGPSPTEPTSECCKALLGADLKCLCGYKTSPLLPVLGIDPDLAMKSAKKCGITPPEDC